MFVIERYGVPSTIKESITSFITPEIEHMARQLEQHFKEHGALATLEKFALDPLCSKALACLALQFKEDIVLGLLYKNHPLSQGLNFDWTVQSDADHRLTFSNAFFLAHYNQLYVTKNYVKEFFLSHQGAILRALNQRSTDAWTTYELPIPPMMRQEFAALKAKEKLTPKKAA